MIMVKRVIGGVFAVAVVGVIVWCILGYGSYSSMLPAIDSEQPHEEPTIECDSIVSDSLLHTTPSEVE